MVSWVTDPDGTITHTTGGGQGVGQRGGDGTSVTSGRGS